jgi:hypothetical protein
MVAATGAYPSVRVGSLRAGSQIDLSGSAQWWIIALMDDFAPPGLDKAL